MVELPKTLRSRLAASARDSHRHEHELLEEAVVEYLDRQEMERAIVEASIASAADTGLISHDAMKAWLSSWGADNELPPPEPDVSRSA